MMKAITTFMKSLEANHPKKMMKAITTFMKSLEANHPKGIHVRSRIAVICALAFIVIDIIFVAYNYNYLPEIIPEYQDVDGVFIEAVNKSTYISYDIQRLIMLLSAFFVAWAIKPCFKTQIIYKRVRCFIFDIVNLTITSAIAITMVEITIAKGESQDISYYSQWITFLFWLAVMAVELAYDLKKIRKENTITSNF